MGTQITIKKVSAVLILATLLGVLSCFHTNKSFSEVAAVKLDSQVVAPVEALGKAFAAIAGHVSLAVVGVYSEKTIRLQHQELPFPFGDDLFREFFGNQMQDPRGRARPREYRIPQHGMASGMLLDHSGYILTNYHVVQDVDEVKVQFADQQAFIAKLIGKDARTDVAIIKIQSGSLDRYPVIALGDSDIVQVGDVVLAIGSPFGLTQTVTHGIISAVGRADVGIVDFEDFLQTDAPINPGNSGGALVNTRGEVIGMNSAIATSVGQSGGVGFSIPSNMIKAMLPQLTKGQSITRGEIGIVIQNLNEGLAESFGLKDNTGVLVAQVMVGSAAEKSGIKPADVIVTIDGKSVHDVRSFRNLVAGKKPGTPVAIGIIRKQASLTLTVIVQEQVQKPLRNSHEEGSREGTLSRLGISAQTLNKDLADRYQLKAKSGVVIVEIEEGSPASFAGLVAGDVIIQSDHMEIKSLDDLNKSINQRKREQFLFLIDRAGTNLFVNIRIN